MTIIDNPATRRAKTCQWFSKVAVDGGTKHDDIVEVPARYEFLSQVGTGGMGIVYKVRDLETGEIVALKMLKPGIAFDQSMQENLRKEVCLARKVTHKNVCRIHEFNRSNGTACISMEFVEGESLLSKLRRVGVLSWSESLDIARQICAGLREAHVQGIVHRDLKPANIMVDRSGSVKIMDFGIARLSQENGQMTGTIAGTPAYMAPEQVELKPMGPRTDIYSLGLLLYEMVTGSPAFDGDTPIAVALKQIRESPRRPCEIVSTLPARAEAVILKCLRKDPAKRFQSVDELDVALETTARTSVAVPGLVTLALVVQRASVEAGRAVRHGVDKTSAFLRAQDWRGGTRTRTGQAVAVLLGSVVALGLGASGKIHVSELQARPSVALSIQRPQSFHRKSESSSAASTLAVQNSAPVSGTIPAAGAIQPVAMRHFDFGRGFEVATEDAFFSDAASPNQIPASQVTSASMMNRVKAPSGTQLSRSLVSGTNSARRKIRPSLAATLHPAQPTAGTAAAAYLMNEQQDLSVSVLPTVSSNPTDKRTGVTNAPRAKEAAWYLEVGSFKDAAWAENAVEKLSQLGYHAVSISKTHLWMQSFHVQVGPFATPEDIEAAQQNLALQHFKPHLVK